MTLRSSELQSDGDLDSIRNSCDVYNYLKKKYSYSEKAKTYDRPVEEVEIISVSLESKSDFTINRCLRGEVFDSAHKGVHLTRR